MFLYKCFSMLSMSQLVCDEVFSLLGFCFECDAYSHALS